MSAELVDRIRLGWIVLTEADHPAASGITTHPIVDLGDEGALLLGIDGAGVPCLLIPTDPGGPEENVGLVRIRNRELETAGGINNFVVISCSEPSLRDVFDHFLAAVIAAVEGGQRKFPGSVAVETLARWKAMLRGTGAVLSRSNLAALLAELLVLEDVVKRDPECGLEVWTGPDEARHDLRRGSEAIEVKSTLSHTARQVTIHGVDQLEPPTGGMLTLAWHRFDVTPRGPLSVFSVADRLIQAGVSAVTLYDRMDAVGSPVSLRDEHDAVRFSIRERRFFAVNNDFPRIVPATFPQGCPSGIDDITYKVTLPANDLALDNVEVERVLDGMAGNL